METQPTNEIGDTWELLVDTAVNPDYMIQNIGERDIMVVASTATPTDNLAYHTLKRDEFIVNPLLLGKVWGRTSSVGKAYVAVSLG